MCVKINETMKCFGVKLKLCSSLTNCPSSECNKLIELLLLLICGSWLPVIAWELSGEIEESIDSSMKRFSTKMGSLTE